MGEGLPSNSFDFAHVASAETLLPHGNSQTTLQNSQAARRPVADGYKQASPRAFGISPRSQARNSGRPPWHRTSATTRQALAVAASVASQHAASLPLSHGASVSAAGLQSLVANRENEARATNKRSMGLSGSGSRRAGMYARSGGNDADQENGRKAVPMLDLSSISLSGAAPGGASPLSQPSPQVQGTFLSGDGAFELHEGTFTLADAAQGLAARSAAHAATVAELSRQRHSTLEPHALLRHAGAARPAGVGGQRGNRKRQRRRSSGADRLAHALGIGSTAQMDSVADALQAGSGQGPALDDVKQQPVLTGMDFASPRESVLFAAARQRLGIRLVGDEEEDDGSGDGKGSPGHGPSRELPAHGRRSGRRPSIQASQARVLAAGVTPRRSSTNANGSFKDRFRTIGRDTPVVELAVADSTLRKGDAWGLAGRQWAEGTTAREKLNQSSKKRMKEIRTGAAGSQTARAGRVGLQADSNADEGQDERVSFGSGIASPLATSRDYGSQSYEHASMESVDS